MNVATHEEMIADVGRPHQFKRGKWRPFADLVAVGHEGLGEREVLGKMHKADAVGFEDFVDVFKGAGIPVHT